MIKSFKFISVVATALTALTMSANAAIISVNIGNNNANNVISSGQTAGVVPATNWNNKLGSFGAAAVTDDSGNLLTTTVAVSTQWSSATSSTLTPNHVLMGSGTDSGGGDMSATITGITFDLYDVYVYFGSRGAAGRYGDYSVTPGGTGASGGGMLRGYDIGTFATVGGFVLEDGSGGPGVGVGNYMVFKNVSGTNLTILASPENPGTPRAPLNGFQIVQVPEPSAALLLGLGGIALTLRRRRK